MNTTTSASNAAGQMFRQGMTRLSWVSSDGRKIPVKKMADAHLMNVLRKIVRAFDAAVDAGNSNRDVAIVFDKAIPCFRALVREALRRELV